MEVLKIMNKYKSLISENTKKSAELFKKACEVIPGGVTANIKYIAPHPLFMEKRKRQQVI